MNRTDNKNRVSYDVEYIIYLMRCLHYALELPISLIQNQTLLQSIPGKHISGYSLLNDPSLLPNIDNIRESETDARVIINRIGERAVILPLPGDDKYLLVGPVLTESIESGTLTNMIRNGLIPFHQKSVMQSYFNSCPILTSERLFYIGKLMEEIIYHGNSNFPDGIFLVKASDNTEGTSVYTSFDSNGRTELDNLPGSDTAAGNHLPESDTAGGNHLSGSDTVTGNHLPGSETAGGNHLSGSETAAGNKRPEKPDPSDDIYGVKAEEHSSQVKQNAPYYHQIREYREDAFLHSPYSIEQKICHTISNGDTENAKRLLTDINLMPHARLASNELRSYKNSIICSCTFMARAAINGGVNPDEAFTLSDSYINRIEATQSIKQLQSFESYMIEGFTEMVLARQNQTYSSTILKTIYYIENHLCENLSLSQLAGEAYVNPGYLSELFHKETGMTITDWIKKKRIEESAIFVLDSHKDFAEIASFYHFCSQSYFSKCFKKIMGVTPGEYRKNNGKIPT